jgi:hypothetical protein
MPESLSLEVVGQPTLGVHNKQIHQYDTRYTLFDITTDIPFLS